MRFPKHWRRWLAALIVLAVLFIGAFLFQSSVQNTAPLPLTWTPHPDFFPLGTVLQGSTVEMSLRLTSNVRAPKPPPWVNRLPKVVRPSAIRLVDFFRAGAAKRKLRIEVDAPDYVRIDRAEMDYHQFFGLAPTVTLHLATDRPGKHDEPLTIRLTGRGYATNTTRIPVRVNVLAKPSRWTVLATETPFEKYATDNGAVFEGLTAIVTRLAEQGVRVDFTEHLPKSLDTWNVILVGGTTLFFLDAKARERLHRFVARGGRLIISADAFMVGTVPKANDLLSRYGLRMDDKDAGSGILASQITSDPLTTGVTELNFWRPACVRVTDPAQAKVLAATKEDEACGFIAVSRALGRGDVIVLAQSLWWNWIKLPVPDPGKNDARARMFENLVTP